MTPEPRYAVPHTRRIAPSARQAKAMSVTVRVAAAKPIQPLRAATWMPRAKAYPRCRREDGSPGRQKAKQVEQQEDGDPEAKRQRRSIHTRSPLRDR